MRIGAIAVLAFVVASCAGRRASDPPLLKYQRLSISFRRLAETAGNVASDSAALARALDRSQGSQIVRNAVEIRTRALELSTQARTLDRSSQRIQRAVHGKTVRTYLRLVRRCLGLEIEEGHGIVTAVDALIGDPYLLDSRQSTAFMQRYSGARAAAAAAVTSAVAARSWLRAHRSAFRFPRVSAQSG